MSFYILQDGYCLRGYQKLPFGITHPNRSYTDFFNKEQYALILDCDGKTDIHKDSVSPDQQLLLDRLLKLNFIRECEKGEELKPEQKYVLYPSVYKNKVQWSITGRCNYLCRHCFLSAPDYHGDDVSIERCMYVLDQLCECGIFSLGITGGEPLVHTDFVRLLEEIRKRNMDLESIYTNCALVNESLLDQLDRLDLHPAFNVSFDGVGCHDWLRGIPGAEKRTVEAIRLLKSRGYNVGAAMCLHRNNISGLRETVNLLADLGCDHLKANGMSYQGNWLEQKDCYLSTEDLFEHLIQYIPVYFEDGAPISIQLGIVFDYNTKTKKIMIPAIQGPDRESAVSRPTCGVIKKALYIGANGRVLPCMSFSGHALEANFDSVFDKPLKEILNDSYYSVCAGATCGDCVEHNEMCRECRYKWICRSGCRAGACDNGKTDYYGIDEAHCLFFRNGYFERTEELLEQYEKK